jgi:polyphenol oxidase
MQQIVLNRMLIYRFSILSQYPNLNHFITTRSLSENKDFNLCLFCVDDIQTVISNRKVLAAELEIPLSSFVFQQQKHTNKVTHVGISERGSGVSHYNSAIEDNDGMITNEKGVCLVVIGGDCVPLLFFDPVKSVIGAVHSGWRGTAQRIAEHAIHQMAENYQCNPSDIIVGIGPSISQECYEVDNTVLEIFSKTYKNTNEFFKSGETPGKYLLDLWKANQLQLIDSGILPGNIEISGLCTYKNESTFFSARRGDKGRFGCGIMLS